MRAKTHLQKATLEILRQKVLGTRPTGADDADQHPHTVRRARVQGREGEGHPVSGECLCVQFPLILTAFG